MVLTVTMNPSVDVSYRLEQLILDDINRVGGAAVIKTAGGKGLNVSRVLRQVGLPVCATGIVGGTTGEFINQKCQEKGIDTQFLRVEEASRNCIAILHEGHQTEILEGGTVVPKGTEALFIEKYQKLISQSRCITISGSVLPGLSSTLYSQMIKLANTVGIKVLLDTSSQQLKNTLLGAHKPYAIKPNSAELSELLGRRVLDTIEELRKALEESLFEGVELVLVSRGANGGFARFGGRYYNITIPKIKVVNPVGSGDSSVAGLVYSLEHNFDPQQTLQHAMLFGMLNATATETGFVDLSQKDKYLDEIIVTEIVE